MLRILHRLSTPILQVAITTAQAAHGKKCVHHECAAMENVRHLKIPQQPRRQPRRPHHIADWAELRGMKQADLARAVNVDKSIVSRWFGGSTPSAEHQELLALLFHCEPESLFRHPDDDWMRRFFEGRDPDERERIKQTLETAFPRAKSA
jgi:DNA-binding transcriptional regulator YiaG